MGVGQFAMNFRQGTPSGVPLRGARAAASQVAEKLPDDVIPKPGAFWRAEESVLFSAARDKSRFLAEFILSVPRGESPTRRARNDSQ